MWIMVIKNRIERLVIVLFRYLNARMNLTDKEVNYYSNLIKGYEGEQKSDIWLKNLTDEWLVIHDLLLEYNHSKFQIDTLIIAHQKIYILDVKYLEGDHLIEGGQWYKVPKKQIQNPVEQLNRCEILLRKLLRELGFNYPIESFLIFNNPEFLLYQPTINPAIINPAQLNRFLKKLNLNPVKLDKRYFKVAEQLVSLHQLESPYPLLPKYNYEQLKKGILSPHCYSFYTELRGGMLLCDDCGCTERVESAVLRCVTELRLLFPDRKITTKAILEWCEIINSEKTIRRILGKHYKLVGSSISSYYVPRNE
jgi:hypothetical protein